MSEYERAHLYTHISLVVDQDASLSAHRNWYLFAITLSRIDVESSAHV